MLQLLLFFGAFAFSPRSALGSESVWVEGITEANEDAALGCPVAGLIAVYHAEEGDVVKEGDVIVELRRELEEIEVERRKIEMDAARRDFERTKQLFDRTGGVSREELDAREAAMKVAEAQHALATANLDRKSVRAPFGGKVIDTYGLQPGEACQQQQPLARLVDARQCVITAFLPAGGKFGLAEGAEVQVRLAVGEGAPTVPAEVIFISPVADPASGLFKIKARFDNPDEGIRPGVTAWLGLPETAPTP